MTGAMVPPEVVPHSISKETSPSRASSSSESILGSLYPLVQAVPQQAESDGLSFVQTQHRRGVPLSLVQSPDSPETGPVQVPRVFVSSQEESGVQVPEGKRRYIISM